MGTLAGYYQAGPGSVLEVDHAFYDRLASESPRREPVERFEIPIRSGYAWEVPAGHLCRIITTSAGPQCGDFNVWNRHNPRERLWTSRTRQLQGTHVTRYDRLWSTLPYLRPLLTITNDTLENYGIDADGGRVHDLRLPGLDLPCDSSCVRSTVRAPAAETAFGVEDLPGSARIY